VKKLGNEEKEKKKVIEKLTRKYDKPKEEPSTPKPKKKDE
jgi:hypothetical protein